MKNTFTKSLSALSVALTMSAGMTLAIVTPAAYATTAAVNGASVEFYRDWIVTPQAGFDLIKQGALVIDARGEDLKKKNGAIPGAVALIWQDLAEPNLPTKGRPLPVEQATKKLQALGISKERPIVVVADSVNGWGEDGRVTWLLRAWGHTRVALVDGGLGALERIGKLSVKPAGVPGDFVASESSQLEIKKEEVKHKLGRKDVAFLDVREPREYGGQTPYGEKRGGHLLPAKHLFFKDLLDKNGQLLPREEIEKVLASRGVTRDKEVVSYCTGGIRSGWVTTVLNDLGYKARNYAGSMWEWSAQAAEEYPLQK
ncbi:rhodanese-like domain-containing protein [Rhodoferax sp.]|uniref:sulfurtransferase n=1 Tax=Rhodoferax sp. TaxID=50421 RepID=UPI0026212495|nr:rhodanese-like domain-containing protein [Rhodoferax sp.]MDD2926970.1 rhodanese-like domain-containing protein [Rhodoferax sp.]